MDGFSFVLLRMLVLLSRIRGYFQVLSQHPSSRLYQFPRFEKRVIIVLNPGDTVSIVVGQWASQQGRVRRSYVGVSSNLVKPLRLSTSASLSWFQRDRLPTVTIPNINYEVRL